MKKNLIIKFQTKYLSFHISSSFFKFYSNPFFSVRHNRIPQSHCPWSQKREQNVHKEKKVEIINSYKKCCEYSISILIINNKVSCFSVPTSEINEQILNKFNNILISIMIVRINIRQVKS